MKQLIGLIALAGFCTFLRATPSLAISLDFVPASQTVSVEDL